MSYLILFLDTISPILAVIAAFIFIWGMLEAKSTSFLICAGGLAFTSFVINIVSVVIERFRKR